MTEVIIGDGVTTIGSYAFWGCSDLTSITIGNSVTDIGENAFSSTPYLKIRKVYINDLKSWCNIKFSNLFSNPLNGGAELYINDVIAKDIVIPQGVTAINDYAFYYCTSLLSVTFSNGVTTIGKEAFSSCENLTDVALPDSVLTIGNGAFKVCGNLTDIAIPNNVTTIGIEAFYGCNSLTEIIIPDSVTQLGQLVFESCDNLKNIIISDNITKLEYGIFKDCIGLTYIEIPNNVTRIENKAFQGCDNLSNVYYTGSEEEWKKIPIGSDNECLINADILFTKIYTATSLLSSTDDYDIFSVVPRNVPVGSTMIFVCYSNSKTVYTEVRIYNGENPVYFVEHSTGEYDTVKILVWENINSLKPLCGAETVKIN